MSEPESSSYARWDQSPVVGRWGLVLAVVVPVLIAAVGFGVISLVSRGPDSTVTSIRVPTSGWIPGQVSGEDLISGTLSVDERRCLYLQGADGRTWPVWPAGYRARIDDDGVVSLLDGGNNLIARDGEQVQAMGSFTSSVAFAGEPCLPSEGEIAAVQSEVTKVETSP